MAKNRTDGAGERRMRPTGEGDVSPEQIQQFVALVQACGKFPPDTTWLIYEQGGSLLGEVQAAGELSAQRIALNLWPASRSERRAIRKEVFERRQRSLDQQLEGVAHHEAGHAVIAVLTGYQVVRVALRPPYAGRWRQPWDSGHLLGFIEALVGHHADRLGSPRHRALAEKRAASLLAGRSAEARYRGRPVSWRRPWADEIESARRLLWPHAEAAGFDRAESFFRQITARVRSALESAWPQVHAVATALAERRELSGDEVHAMVTGGGCGAATRRCTGRSRAASILRRR